MSNMRIEKRQIDYFSKLARADFDCRAAAYLGTVETDWGGVAPADPIHRT